MFEQLKEINHRPKPYEFYTAEMLWNDPYTSAQMLAMHLNESVDMSSRNKDFIERSVNWICSRFSVGEGTAACDFGCGPGLYTLRLAMQGAFVTGVDFSERSIAYARKTAEANQVRINYVLQNYLTFEADQQFDLVTMIMCDYCALGPAQRKKLLEKFYSILKDDGFVLLDVYSLAAFEKRQEVALYEFRQLNGFWAAEDYYGFMNTYKYEDDKVVLDKYTIVEKERTRHVYNWLQYFSLESLTAELNACGLEIKEVYADLAGSPYWKDGDEFAIAAGKM